MAEFGIPVTPCRPVLVEWNDGTQSVVVPLSDRLVGMTAARRDEYDNLYIVSRRAVRVIEEAT